MYPKLFFKRYVNKRTITLFLLLALLSPILLFLFKATRFSIYVTIDFFNSIGTSHFSPGMTFVDNTLNYPWGNNDLNAVNRIKSLIKNAIPFENTHIMAWGITDPWPDPSQPEPSDWSLLDSRLQQIIETGGMPVITLNEAPWWMKGQLQSDGTTRLITQSEEWSDVAYAARILDNEMDAWLHLVQRVAERYMVPPYNVRYFQVWNELKGYYDSITNAYDYTTNPGDPSGPNAKHGYTYMYNRVYSRLMQIAMSLGIPTSSIKIGGPYVVMDSWSTIAQSHPSKITKAYGTYDQRPLDVVKYWLQHKAGAGFITVDGDNGNKDNVNIIDPFTASEKFADVTQWVRSLDNTLYPGAATIPIWWAEWYASPYANTGNTNYNNAIKSYAMIKLLKAGGAVAFAWGGLGEGTPGSGLWTAPTAGGGQPLPWYNSYKAFKDYFAPGTQLYTTTISDPTQVEALASAAKTMLVNKTAKTLTISVNGTLVTLNPYLCNVINTPQPTSAPTNTLTPTATPTPTPIGAIITTVDDSVQGSGQTRWTYTGTGWQHCTNCNETNPTVIYSNASQSWTSTINDTATLTFTGTQIQCYAVTAPWHGIGAVSIDGGTETNVDFYSTTKTGEVLLWTSPILPSGTHTFKLRVTGTQNPSSTGTTIAVDGMDILG